LNYEWQYAKDSAFSVDEVHGWSGGPLYKLIPLAGNLDKSTDYYWRVKIWEGLEYSSYSVWRKFTTDDNTAPTQSGEVPTNGSTGVSTTPSLYVICNDADGGDILTATWRSNSSGGWVDFATNISISPGTNITQSFTNATAYSTTYYWSANVTDGTYWTNETYSFTTSEYVPDPPSGGGSSPNPGDTTLPTTPANVRCTTPEIDNTPSFSWNASTDTSGISGYYVKIDDGTDTWVGNVFIWASTTAVEEGSHTFYVKAKDASSNRNIGSYGSCSFTINTTVVGPVAYPNGPYTGLTLQNIYFDGSDSYDTDGTITNYTWDFGDGTTGHNVSPTHIYNLSGVYNVTLTVKDNDNLTDSNTTTAIIILDSDGDGWSDEIEQSYETNITGPDDYPLDTDSDGIPDEDSPDGKYTGDLDDDNDGLDDEIEDVLGSNPKNETDVTSVDVEGITYYLVDIDEDGQSNIFYNTITKNSTILGIRNDGAYLIDVDEDSEWDYIYDPASKTVTPYEEKPSEEFPWLLVIIGIIIATIVIIIILFLTGYIRIEEEYIEE